MLAVRASVLRFGRAAVRGSVRCGSPADCCTASRGPRRSRSRTSCGLARMTSLAIQLGPAAAGQVPPRPPAAHRRRPPALDYSRRPSYSRSAFFFFFFFFFFFGARPILRSFVPHPHVPEINRARVPKSSGAQHSEPKLLVSRVRHSLGVARLQAAACRRWTASRPRSSSLPRLASTMQQKHTAGRGCRGSSRGQHTPSLAKLSLSPMG